MTQPYSTITISTVGDLLDHAYRLHAHCRGCRQSKVVDLEVIAWRVGRRRSYLNGSLRLRRECGSRDVAIPIEAPSNAIARPGRQADVAEAFRQDTPPETSEARLLQF